MLTLDENFFQIVCSTEQIAVLVLARLSPTGRNKTLFLPAKSSADHYDETKHYFYNFECIACEQVAVCRATQF